jgi:hypothetical protein
MSEEQDARWQQIVDARVDFSDEAPASDPMPYDDDQVVPLEAAERNRTRTRDRKAAQFNEALSSFSSWSSVEPRRRRMSA